jgi:hypothetical protein
MLGEPYPAPPSALPPTPRRAELTRKARCHRGAALVLLLLAPNVFLAVALATGDDLRALEKRGQSVEGEVVRKETIYRSRGGNTYRVCYQFWVGGRVYGDWDDVDAGLYNRLSEKSPVRVTYLAADPTVHCLGSPADHLNRRTHTFLLIAGLAAAGCLI